MVLALALAGSVALVPGAVDAPPAKANCLNTPAAHTTSPHDPNSLSGSRSIQGSDAAEEILRTAYDRHTLPRTMLTKGPDGNVHARLSSGQAKIPVNVHVVHDGATGMVPVNEILRQIAELNRDYGNTPAKMFSFWLHDVDYTDNKAWHYAMAMQPDEKAMKSALRKGDASELNLYLNEPGYEKPADLIGIATWPWDYQAAPELDGVMLKYSTVPGGGAKPFDEGKQASHETGHWLGLYHTFEGGCAAPGDYVDDTPAEAAPTSGCPTDLKACDNTTPAPVPQLHGLQRRPVSVAIHSRPGATSGRPLVGLSLSGPALIFQDYSDDWAHFWLMRSCVGVRAVGWMPHSCTQPIMVAGATTNPRMKLIPEKVSHNGPGPQIIRMIGIPGRTAEPRPIRAHVPGFSVT